MGGVMMSLLFNLTVVIPKRKYLSKQQCLLYSSFSTDFLYEGHMIQLPDYMTLKS